MLLYEKSRPWHEMFDTRMFFSSPLIFPLLVEAFQHREIWNLAVEIAEQLEVRFPYFVLIKTKGRLRVGLFIDDGKCFYLAARTSVEYA